MATLLNADWLSSREIRVKVEICRATNPRECARLCTAKVWRDKSKKIARYASIRSLCMGSCRPVVFGVNALEKFQDRQPILAGPFASYKKHVCDTGYRYGYVIWPACGGPHKVRNWFT